MPRTASELRFASEDIFTVIQENDTTVRDLAYLNVLGNGLNEPLTYSILNPDGMFEIRPTAGVLRNTGIAFDREKQDQYDIVVEVRTESEEHLESYRICLIYCMCSRFKICSLY